MEDANQSLRNQIAPLESSYHELRAKSSSTLAGLTFKYLKVKGADDVRGLLKYLKEQIALGQGLDPGEHTWISIWSQVLRDDLEENDLEKKCHWKSGGQAAKLLAIESSLSEIVQKGEKLARLQLTSTGRIKSKRYPLRRVECLAIECLAKRCGFGVEFED